MNDFMTTNVSSEYFIIETRSGMNKEIAKIASSHNIISNLNLAVLPDNGSEIQVKYTVTLMKLTALSGVILNRGCFISIRRTMQNLTIPYNSDFAEPGGFE